MCFTTWEWWRRRWWCFTKVTTYLFISLWKKCYGLRQQKLGHKIVCRQILWPVWTAVMVWSRVTQYCYFVNFLFIVPYELYKCAWWFTLLSRIFRWFKYKSFEFLFTDECQGIAKFINIEVFLLYICVYEHPKTIFKISNSMKSKIEAVPLSYLSVQLYMW